MPWSALTGFVSRKQLLNLMNGEVDFVALRLDKLNPDDVAFHAQGRSLPTDVVEILQQCADGTEDAYLQSRIKEILSKPR